MSIKLIVAGSRHCSDYGLIKTHIHLFRAAHTEQELIIVSGAAKGVDTLGEQYATEHFLPIMRFKADWQQYGRSAGPIRNAQMAKAATHLLAFWDEKRVRSGTLNMIKTAYKHRLAITIVSIATGRYVDIDDALNDGPTTMALF